MMSAQKNQPSWAEIVKGKRASPQPVETEFQLNPDVQEFKPQVNQSLNPCAKDFDPQLMDKAAQMTNLLLDCYSDSDDDDDDDDDKENRRLHVVAAPVTQSVTASKVVACAQLNPLAKTFSPPVTKSLDASAKEFDPQLMQKAAQMANVLLECYSDSDGEDDDDHCEPIGRRAVATPATSAKASACAQLNPSAKVFSPPAGDVKSLPAAAFRPPPGLTLPDVVQMNMDCYSSDDESPCAPSPARARKRVSKLGGGSDGDSDSTTTGNSDTESLSM